MKRLEQICLWSTRNWIGELLSVVGVGALVAEVGKDIGMP